MIPLELAGMTLAAVLRALVPGQSWNQVRRLIATRRVRVGRDLCLDPARRLSAGESIELLPCPLPQPMSQEAVKVRYLDRHLVVVEKPPGIATVRHPAEREWSKHRRALTPTLDDLIAEIIARRTATGTYGAAETGTRGEVDHSPRPRPVRRVSASPRRRPPRLRVVQRLDKETSGLVVFARTVAAERGLGRQFRRHTVARCYLAVVSGTVASQRIASRLVRDRGDGRRGSTKLRSAGKDAVTHIDVVEHLPGYTLLSCRLETGRTHQIRIHLAELGHPVCGDKVYNRKFGGEPAPHVSGAPRLALHAAELGFIHPVTGEATHWTMPLPSDLREFIERLRGATSPRQPDQPGRTPGDRRADPVD